MPGIFIDATDLEVLTGQSRKTACRYLQRIKDTLKKRDGQHITISEYCKYEGIQENEVRRALKPIIGRSSDNDGPL